MSREREREREREGNVRREAEILCLEVEWERFAG